MKKYITELLIKLINSRTDKDRINVIVTEIKNLNLSYEIIKINESIKKDKYFTENDEIGRENIEVIINNGSNKTILLNSHFDTVPCSEKMEIAVSENDKIYGRGACDALGQIVMIIASIKKLKETGGKFHNVVLHLVNCEETGGNGSLTLLSRKLPHIDYGIVFEPTNFEICNACRGALWFNLEIFGIASHMGKYQDGDNAIYKMNYIISELEKYWENLINESKNHEYFKYYKMPIQVNLGMVNGGLINASLPDKVTLNGAVGFLSNKNMDEIKIELTNSIELGIENYKKRYGDKTISDFKINFNSLHNDPYNLNLDETEVLKKFSKSYLEIMKNSPIIKGFPASCDARLYKCRNNIPVLVFGVGKLEHAHSEEEEVIVSEIEKGIDIVCNFLQK